MSQTLSIGLTISAIGLGGVLGAFGKVNERVASLGSELDRLRSKRNSLKETLQNPFIEGSKVAALYERDLAKVERRIVSLREHRENLRSWATTHAANRQDLQGRVGDAMAVWGIGRALGAPIGAHMRQDDALTNLKVAMLGKSGVVGADFEKLRKEVVALGNALPGTTADFSDAARALMEQGVAMQAVLGGGLRASANMATVLRMNPEEAAEMTAKLREAYGLQDAELMGMADSAQRAKFAFGMKTSDLLVAASYQAPMLNVLGIGGKSDMDQIFALQGMAAQKGLEGSSFGTNFAMMLTRLATGPDMVENARRGLKASAGDYMAQAGVSFDFFDAKGNFGGVDNMVKELSKLNTIREKLGEKAALETSTALFGQEASRPALLIAKAGYSGFQEAQQRMAAQANLQQRIDLSSQSTRNNWDALTGSVENFGAAAAGPALRALLPLGQELNRLAGWLTGAAESSPRLSKWLGLLVVGALGTTMAFLGLGIALSVVRFAFSGLMIIPGMARVLPLFATGLRLVGAGLRLAGRAGLFLGRALLLNPIGLLITAIALGAYLIWKHWDKIEPWFKNLWAKTKTHFNSFVTWLKGLPSAFASIGRNLVDGLVNGVTSKLSAARNTIVGFGQNIKGWFASTLGIKSPSRVFMAFGGHIADGARLGIDGGAGRVKTAAQRMAKAAAGAAAIGIASGAGAAGGAAGMGGGAAGVTIHFSPVIHAGAGGAQDVLKQIEREALPQLERLLARVLQEQRRRSLQ